MNRDPCNEVMNEEENAGARPVFLKHPDGSMSEGVPPGYKETPAPRSPRQGRILWWDDSMAAEFDFIYSRHEKLFVSLLLMEFVVEFTFNVMYLFYAKYSVREVGMVYHTLSQNTLWVIFWVLFGAEVAYCIIYYTMGFCSVWTSKPRYYRWFSHVALVGILGQVLLAYMNKFNLLIFFLRLMAYIYAKFLRNLLLSLYLLPESSAPPGVVTGPQPMV